MLRIPVVDSNHQPLMPTTSARARKWIESGKAIKRWLDCGQFYVQLTVAPSGYDTQDIIVGIDPGKNYSGIGVQSARFTLYAAHLILPFKIVRERMDNRRLMRRGRRGRRINKRAFGGKLPPETSRRKVEFPKRAHRQKRFSNRRQGKLPPSIRANRQLELADNSGGCLRNVLSRATLRIVAELCKIYPVCEIRYEYIRADVDKTSGRRRAKSGKGFSPVMVGQRWMLEQLSKIALVVKVEGYQTAQTRNHLGLVKNKADKSKPEFNTHAVDGCAIAASHFVEYRKYHRLDMDGANWFGSVIITTSPFFVIRRPPYSRRQLHLMVPAIGGIRRKYGGSITRHGLRKGDLVHSPKGIGYVSGDTEKQISVSNANWKRLGQIASSKVTLIRRSNGLVVA